MDSNPDIRSPQLHLTNDAIRAGQPPLSAPSAKAHTQQLVIGSPGAGKSTYCDGSQCNRISGANVVLADKKVVHQFLSAIGRKCSVVNLDPANDHVSYPAAIDVRDLVTLEDIMEAEELGPNGGVLYALEELEHNIEWFEKVLKGLERM